MLPAGVTPEYIYFRLAWPYLLVTLSYAFYLKHATPLLVCSTLEKKKKNPSKNKQQSLFFQIPKFKEFNEKKNQKKKKKIEDWKDIEKA